MKNVSEKPKPKIWWILFRRFDVWVMETKEAILKLEHKPVNPDVNLVQVIEMKDHQRIVGELESENIDLRMRKALGDYCEHCEPIYCCNGQMCGCYAMPTGFKSTDKCSQYCSVKSLEKREKEDQLKSERLAQLESFVKNLDPQFLPKDDRNARLYFIFNKLTPEPITAEQVKF